MVFENNQFRATTDIGRKFKLDKGEHRMIDTMIRSIPNQWVMLLQQKKDQTLLGSWVGCFEDNSHDAHPMAVFQSCEFFRPLLEVYSWAPSPLPPPTLQNFHITVNSWSLDMGDPWEGNASIHARWYRMVRIYTTSKGEKKPRRDVYIGRREMLELDSRGLIGA